MVKGSQQVTEIRHMGMGLYREWIADGRVCVLLATQSGHEVTDVWTTTIKTLLIKLTPANPYT